MSKRDLSLEERFNNFLLQVDGAESIDTSIPEEVWGGQKRADFLIDQRQVIIEIKTLKTNPANKIEEQIEKHRERPDFPLMYWKADLNNILSHLPDGDEINAGIWHAITRSIQSNFESANKQIISTKKCLNLSSCGVLVLLNDSVGLLDPNQMIAAVNKMFLKKKNNTYRYRDISYVWIVSETHSIKVGLQNEILPVIVISGPTADEYPEADLILEKLMHEWSNYRNVPLLKQKLPLHDYFQNLSPRQNYKNPPTKQGTIRRQDLWIREYQNNPYLRNLSTDDFLRHTAKIFNAMTPHFLKDGKKLKEADIKELIMGWTHTLEEAKYRNMNMKKLGPFIKNGFKKPT